MPNSEKQDQRLDSWKEVASYLGRDVRTVVRWEKERGLPIRRVPGGQRNAIFAYKREVDEWLDKSSHSSAPSPSKTAELTPAPKRAASPYRYVLVAVVALSALLVLSAGLLSIHSAGPTVVVDSVSKLTDDGKGKEGLVANESEAFFAEIVDGQALLSAVPVSGGTVRHLKATLPNPFLVDIHPDGLSLLVVARSGIDTDQPLWIVPLTGEPRLVGAVRCHDAAWSADGKILAYATGNDVYLSTDEGRSARSLYSLPSFPRHLRWAADGKHLRLLLSDPTTGNGTPWELTLDDRLNVAAVTSLSLLSEQCCADWTSSSMGYLFLLAAQPSNAILASRESKWPGDTPKVLKASAITFEGMGSLGLHSTLFSTRNSKRLFVLSPNRKNSEFLRFVPRTRAFEPFLPNIEGTDLDFSPDGQQICFVRLLDRTLWVSHSDGSHQKQLTFPPMTAMLPQWAPDGRRIAFIGREPDKHYRILVISREGGTPSPASNDAGNQGAPTWSPDGKQIVYANLDNPSVPGPAVHRINVSTGKEEELPNSHGLRTARVSPDGRHVAALNPTENSLWLFDVKKQNWTRLANEANRDDLRWSHDSQYIYFGRSANEAQAIIRVRVSNGTTEKVANLGAFSSMGGNFNAWFYVAPDDSIILLRQAISSEIYAIQWNDR